MTAGRGSVSFLQGEAIHATVDGPAPVHTLAALGNYRLNMEENQWKWRGKSGDGDRRIRRKGMGIGGLDQNACIKFSANNKLK